MAALKTQRTKISLAVPENCLRALIFLQMCYSRKRCERKGEQRGAGKTGGAAGAPAPDLGAGDRLCSFSHQQEHSWLY